MLTTDTNKELELAVEDMRLFPDETGRDLKSDPVLAFDPRWSTNADMIADLSLLGWFDGPTLDMTYGCGNFWSKYRPDHLTTNDLNPTKGEVSFDWTKPEFPVMVGRLFETVVFDPPYKTQGTPKPTRQDRYGLNTAYTAAELKTSIETGIVNGTQCVAVGGLFMVKCQAQQTSGWYFDQPNFVHQLVEAAGFKQQAVTYLQNRPPSQRSQKTPRNNLSQLVIFRRTKPTPNSRGATRGEQAEPASTQSERSGI